MLELPVWSFSVMIPAKEDGRPRFCLDYGYVNCRMKIDRFLLPKNLDIFHALAEVVYVQPLTHSLGTGMQDERTSKVKKQDICLWLSHISVCSRTPRPKE